MPLPSSDNKRPLALIEITNAMQLRASSITKDGAPISMALCMDRLQAEKLARTLLRYALPGETWVRLDEAAPKKTTFLATYVEGKWKPATVVNLRDATRLNGVHRARAPADFLGAKR